MLGQRINQPDGGGVRLDIDPQAIGCGLGGLWPYAGDDRARVRAMPTRFHHRRAGGEHTASSPPVLIISRVVAGGGSPHGPVGGDVLDLPATLSQSLGQRSVAMSARGSKQFAGRKLS